MHQRPRAAARLEQYVVDLQPAGLDEHVFRAGAAAGGRRGLAGQVGIDARLADTGAQLLRQVAEALLHLAEPLAQVVGAREELRLAVGVVEQARLVALQVADAIPVFALGRGQQPLVVVDVELRLGFRQVFVLARLRL